MFQKTALNLKELKELTKIQPNASLLLLDVRTPEEHKELRIKGCINIPINELHNRMYELRNYETIITICAHGVRSKKAAGILSELPCKILYVNGNIEEWIAEGIPVEKG